MLPFLDLGKRVMLDWAVQVLERDLAASLDIGLFNTLDRVLMDYAKESSTRILRPD